MFTEEKTEDSCKKALTVYGYIYLDLCSADATS